MKKKSSAVLAKADFDHIAKLANLPLTPAQVKLFLPQLAKTLGYVQQLQELKTQDVEPTAQVTGLTNVFREDEVKPGLTQEQALKNAPASHNGFFKVKSVFEP